MKRILALILFLSGVAWGQNTSVTGQVTDSNSIPWRNGTFKFTFVGPPGAQWTGGALPTTVTGSLSGSGAIPATNVPSNSQINPPGTSWIAQACSATLPQVCYSTPVTITGASQTVNLTPNAISIQAPSSPQLVIPVTLYDDSEISGGWVGFTYYNATTAQNRTCSATTGQNCSAWVAGSGGGGVTSIATTSPISGGTITTTGTLSCPTCVTASAPGAGIAHFAGATQAVTSSAIVQGDVTNGYDDLSSNQTVGGNKTLTGNTTMTAGQNIAQFYSTDGVLWVDGNKCANIAACTTLAGSNPATIIIPNGYAGTDCPAAAASFPPKIAYVDLRGINVTTICTQNTILYNASDSGVPQSLMRAMAQTSTGTAMMTPFYGQSIYNNATITAAGQGADGLSGECDFTGTLTISSGNVYCQGSENDVVVASTGGNILTAIGTIGYVNTRAGSTTTITTAIGGKFIGANSILGSGAITNVYDVYAPEATNGTTRNYALAGFGPNLLGYGSNAGAAKLDAEDSAHVAHPFITIDATPNTLIRAVGTAGLFFQDSAGGSREVITNTSAAFSIPIVPTVAGAQDIGTTALPWGNLWLGTAATNNFKLQPAATSAARVISILDPGVATTLNLASSTSTTANLPMLSTTTAGVEAPSTIAYPTSLTSGGLLYASSTTQISSGANIAANKIIKAGGAGTQPSASCFSDAVTAQLTSCTNFLTGINTVRLTANSSAITALTPGTAVLTFGTLPVSTNLSFHCHILYNQQTAAAAGTGFAVQGATNAPTRLDAWGNMFTSLAGAQVEGVAQNITTTTATAVMSGTPSAITTVFAADLNGSVQVGASATTLTILAFTGNASDSITVQAGSFCSISP